MRIVTIEFGRLDQARLDGGGTLAAGKQPVLPVMSRLGITGIMLSSQLYELPPVPSLSGTFQLPGCTRRF